MSQFDLLLLVFALITSATLIKKQKKNTNTQTHKSIPALLLYDTAQAGSGEKNEQRESAESILDCICFV